MEICDKCGKTIENSHWEISYIDGIPYCDACVDKVYAKMGIKTVYEDD